MTADTSLVEESSTKPSNDSPPPYLNHQGPQPNFTSHPDPYEDFQHGILSGWLFCQVIASDETSRTNITPPDLGSLPWVAILCIVAKDLPTLMKTGFYWDEENIIENEGSVLEGPGSLHSDPIFKNFNFTRRYFLADQSQSCRWFGSLEVHSQRIRNLGRFRIGDLAPENIVFAHALNRRREKVWNYALLKPQLDFNTICEDKPLVGWWPPPRPDTKAQGPWTAKS